MSQTQDERGAAPTLGPRSSDEVDASGETLVTLRYPSGFRPGEDPTVAQLQRDGGRDGGPIFVPGETLAARYRIRRFLAQGGMGEIYAAEDLELKELVALKTVLPEIAGSRGELDRFRREIRLARKVTHPNVCRVFDVFHHRTERSGVVTFLTMELLEGETLAELMRRAAPLKTDTALPIVRQMAAGLAAAHRAGVVHGDFKSGNVFLVPEEGGMRAVITDFGLATGRAESEDGGASDVILGTPPYMAPELLTGSRPSAASDVYALGVVLYTMVTRKWPFPNRDRLITKRRLLQEPAPPSRHVPDLDPLWDAAIVRCLRRDPKLRFRTATDLLEALEPATPVEQLSNPSLVAAAVPAEAARGGSRGGAWRRGRVALWLAAGGIALLASTSGMWLPGQAREDGQAAAPGTRRSAAVIGLTNLSRRGETAWLATALTEMLGTELAAGAELRVLAGADVARGRLELGIDEPHALGRDGLAAVRRNLGPDLVLVGSYLSLGPSSGGRVRLDLRLLDTASGESLASISHSGTEDRLFELVSQIGERLRRTLGMSQRSDAGAESVRAALPADARAVRLYAEGLGRLRVFDAIGAQQRLERAVQLEPEHAMMNLALAEAWQRLGHDAKAATAAQIAYAKADTLPREDRLLVEARLRQIEGRWPEAIEIDRALWTFYPDNFEHGLRLAAAQTAAGRGHEALETIEALRRRAPPGGDPRIDLGEAGAAESLSDARRQQEAAGRAAVLGRGQGSLLLVAAARASEGAAWRTLSELQRAAEAYEEAREIFASAGDRGGIAQMLTEIAKLRRHEGRIAEARELNEEALAHAREIGDRRSMAVALTNLAVLLRQEGNFAMALELHREVLALKQEVDDKLGIAISLNSMAFVQRRLLDLQAARSGFEEALQIGRSIGHKLTMTISLNNLAEIRMRQGDLAGAREMYESALEIDKEIGSKRGQAYSLYYLGEVLAAEDRLDEAQRAHERALELRQEIGEKRTAADSRMALARLALEHRDPEAARRLAAAAAAEYLAQRAPDDLARAQMLEATALFAAGEIAEARTRLGAARDLLSPSENREVQLLLRMHSEPMEPQAGILAAVERLSALLREVQGLGLADLQLEVSLRLGEAELRAGLEAQGRERLAALEADALARGFRLVARKAHEAARR
jgi:eukaryotic-like serine/threonine-protein kinase